MVYAGKISFIEDRINAFFPRGSTFYVKMLKSAPNTPLYTFNSFFNGEFNKKDFVLIE
jgi:hypothetical protein